MCLERKRRREDERKTENTTTTPVVEEKMLRKEKEERAEQRQQIRFLCLLSLLSVELRFQYSVCEREMTRASRLICFWDTSVRPPLIFSLFIIFAQQHIYSFPLRFPVLHYCKSNSFALAPVLCVYTSSLISALKVQSKAFQPSYRAFQGHI